MKKYLLKNVVKSVNKRYSLKLNNYDIEKITKKLTKAGFLSSVLKSEITAIEAAVVDINKPRFNPLQASASYATVNSDNCPLCPPNAVSSHLAEVSLADGRKARYCVEHTVTIPLCVKKE